MNIYYMKRIKFQWFGFVPVVFALFAVASCTDTDTNGINHGRVPVQFTSQIMRHQSGSEALHPGSRAVDTKWSPNDQVGIYMIAHEGSLPAGADFSRYKVSGSGGESVVFVPTDADETLYYPTDGSSVNFVAFSPYVAPTDNAAIYSAFSDQSEPAKMEAVDFLYHKGTTAYNQTDASATLTFTHELSKLVIEVVTTDDATQIDLTALDIQVTGVPDAVTANLSDGSLTASGSTTRVTPFVTDVSGKRTATAILVPHASGAGRSIEFTVPNVGVFTHAFAHDYTFASGKEYQLTFTLNRKGAKLDGMQINDWLDGSWTDTGSYTFELLTDKQMVLPVGGGDFDIAFRTDYAGGAAVRYSTSATDAYAGKPDWMTASALNATESSGVLYYTGSFSVGQYEIPLACYAHITVGRVTTVVTIEKQGLYPVAASANCVMLPTTGACVLIPVSRANEYTTFVGAATPAIGAADALTAEVLWSDTDGLLTTVEAAGTGAEGFIKVVAAPGKAGNAVVAVRVGGEIKWSWHVWVVDYDPDNGGGTFTNTYNTNDNGKSFIFMDRNLGATFAGTGSGLGTGLFYQWGRKDPFPATGHPGSTQPGGGSFTVARTNAERGTVANAIQNPTVFLGGENSSNFDWLWIGDNTLWGHGTLKSIYDPCPAGWRVPSFANNGENDADSPWAGFGNEYYNPANTVGGWSAGWTWGTHAAYPAAGSRNLSTGTIGSAGSSGCYWSSLVSSTTDAYGLGFDSTTVFTRYSSNRSCGFSVRCVSDSTI